MSPTTISSPSITQISADTFHDDVQFLETRWRRVSIAGVDLPLIDLSPSSLTARKGASTVDRDTPLIFVPILEHLEFVYARQVHAFSQSRRVILYRRHESRTRFMSLAERVEELRNVCDALDISSAGFVAHGDAAMVLFEFALRYPERCRSLVIVAQAADYRIAPHPLIWLLHEAFLRLPIEHLIPTQLLRNMVVRYITHSELQLQSTVYPLTRLPENLIKEQFRKIALWPAIYRYSVLPIIHNFDIRDRLALLTMPVLLINRQDDALSPEAKTFWLARHLPRCSGYHIVPGCERFFLYSEAELVNPLIEAFLATLSLEEKPEFVGNE